MYWNHRVVDMSAENDGEPLFAIREVHYEDNGMPTGHGEPSVMSESMEGLNWVLDQMKAALDQPVLTPEDFKGEVK
jgi:hypothetical protein